MYKAYMHKDSCPPLKSAKITEDISSVLHAFIAELDRNSSSVICIRPGTEQVNEPQFLPVTANQSKG